MCGINGILSKDSFLIPKIIKMNNLISHRGPDDEGYLLFNTLNGEHKCCYGKDTIDEVKSKYDSIENINYKNFDLVFATRRLSIIDLSSNGHQPMKDETGKYWITYNGEIYNYIEIRNELKNKGYKFYTQSDTEVVIKAYKEWGNKCVNHFNGMWGFAIWDDFKKELFLSRDRFGIKPLYYIHKEDFFAFSSEIKPLIHFLDNKVTLNEKKIPFFILYGNRLNKDDTYHKEIKSLEASHNLLYKNNDVITKRYYKIRTYNLNESNENELEQKLINLLSDSVKLRFRSDVPVGTCLSGGFDSTSIISLSRNFSREKLNTFSATWKDKECDESRYIDIANMAYGTIENKIEPKAVDFEHDFNQINYYQEIPSEGPGLLPQWYVMQKAKEKVKVLLDGQGGDEVFGGYFVKQSYLRGLIKDKKYKDILSEIKLFINFINKEEMHRFTGWLFPKFYNNIFRRHLSNRFNILNNDLMKRMKSGDLNYDAETPKKFTSYLNDLSYHFITQMTIPTLLHYEDRSSMAHSIESRVPFLDYRLVEFGINLPSKYLVNNKGSRPLFRKAMQAYLPKEIVSRTDKMGYPTPFAKWTRTVIKDYVNDIISTSNVTLDPYINKVNIIKRLNSHNSEEIDFSWEIWRLLSLDNFLKLKV